MSQSGILKKRSILMKILKAGITCITAVLILSPNLSFGKLMHGGVIEKNGAAYLANSVVVKMKNLSPLAKGNGLLSSKLMNKAGALSVSKAARLFSQNDEGLSSIVEIKYNASKDPKEAALLLMESGEVEWAEPRYFYTTDYLVNDPSLPNQWGLEKIMAEKAWDICKGDTNIVIGIVDSGVDWDHPDLLANIKTNWKEIPGNGIDDDNNGYIDDIHGWDFGGLTDSPDNDPVEDRADHGTHVAGIAAAVTNNGAGIASIGFNCRLLPVKTSSDNLRDANNHPYIVYGYEGIVYAADNGAKIINCSWGGSEDSKFGREAVKYAISKGALVVVSAGNSDSDALQYPAAYPGVVSVAATDMNDGKCSFSSFGKNVTVSAPGEQIYSTWFNDAYETLRGTSMASPLVAGLAALVAAKFPSYTPLQIGEQIRVNCDDISGLNPFYNNLLGRGRINAFRTLSNTNSVSLRVLETAFSDEAPGGNGNGSFEADETVSVTVKFVNVLAPSSSVLISLESASPYVKIENGAFVSPLLETMGTFDNSSSKFTFTVLPDAPFNAYVPFILKFKCGEYSDFQWIDSVMINPSFQTISSAGSKLTLTSNGNLGFCDWWDNTLGEGFRYKGGANLLFEGALMYGVSPSRLSNSARGISEKDSSFKAIKNISLYIPGKAADEHSFCIFNDDGALDKKLGIETQFSGYAWHKEANDKFIILYYKMINKSGSDISGLYTGLYMDWNLTLNGEQADNVSYDINGGFGYAYRAADASSPYVGCALLSGGGVNFYAIENGARDGGVGVYSGSGGFTRSEKWLTLTNGLKKTKVENGDASFVISEGPDIIKAGDTINVAFAVSAADNLDGLGASILLARERYKLINPDITGVDSRPSAGPKEYSLAQNYPNPFNPSTVIKYAIPSAGNVNLKFYDVLGREIATLVNEYKPAGEYSVEFNCGKLASGVYMYKIEAGGFSRVRKMILAK
jgi:subtilisin family serine protease